MKNQKQPSSFTRRNFLRSAGVATGAAVVAPIMPNSIGKAIAKTIHPTGTPIKIGIILHRGSAASESLLNGINLYLKQIDSCIGRHPVELIVEDPGTGIMSFGQAAEKLMAVDEVSMVLGMCNSRVTEGLRKIANQYQTPFIEVSAGECIPTILADDKFLFRSTLNLWQAHTAMGNWAAENFGKKAFIATSFFNAGFDFHRGFAAGFENAGGEVMGLRVTGSPTTQDHPSSILSAASNADVVYGSYSDYDALIFAQAYKASGLQKPLLGTNFLGGEKMANRRHTSLAGLRFASTWTPNLANHEHSKFVADYHAFTRKAPDAFASLGFDTAGTILSAALALHGNTRGENFQDAMHAMQYPGTRGALTVDGRSHSVHAPIYLCKISEEGDIVTECELSHIHHVHHRLFEENLNSLTGGWLNTYMAV